jgi:Tfp pilus assembly protein PilN
LKVAGLSIEDSHIRASLAEKKLGTIETLKEEDFELPTGEDERKALLANVLRTWKEESGVKGLVAGLDFRHFSFHYVELPVKSRDDIFHALGFEMEKYLPLPPEEYLFDFITVEATDEGTRNLVLAINRSKLGWIFESASEAGIKPLGVRCSGIEALNGLLAAENAAEALFLYRGESDYLIMGLRSSLPVILKAARSVSETAFHLEKLSETFKMGIYSTGIEETDALERFDVKPLSYSTPALLALSALKKRPINLIFLPEELKAKRVDFYPYALAAMCAVSVLAFFSTTWLSYYKDYSALKTVNASIEEIKRSSSELMQTQREFESIDEKRRFLLEFQQGRNKHIRILRRLSTLLPKDAWLTNFTTNGKGRIEIQGYAKRSASLISPLEKSSSFKNVEFSSPVTIRDKRERFSIKMEMEE